MQTAGTRSAFHLYVVRTSERELLSAGLADAGIETRAYYTTPLHLQPAMRAHTGDRRLQSSEQIAREGLALPMGPALRDEDVAAIVAAARAIG